ncbi:MAG TPA: hypothetical protein P5228_08245 [Bacteroidales bacterium]|nr:hypothetical protein [Bacteroidales bacterium]HRZ50022.1 hypothetical protein [Bacteroidales bacterium]
MDEQQEMKLQVKFLNLIKRKIGPENSAVYELSELLGVSIDSIYRRMRGETDLSFEEIMLLTRKYSVSMDMLGDSAPGMVAFHYSMLDNPDHFRRHWIAMLNDLQQIRASVRGEVIYAAIDIPIFHHFRYPALMNFKLFYWQREVISDPALKDQKFSEELVDPAIQQVASGIYEAYSRIPSSEIWTEETLNSTVKQIRFYYDSGLFASREDAIRVTNELISEFDYLEKQIEHGNKADLLASEPQREGNFSFYVSDIEIGSNTVLTRRDGGDSIYMGFQTFNTIITTNSRFCSDTELWLKNLIRKSNLISGVSAKQRYQFFQSQRNKVNRLREYILREG